MFLSIPEYRMARGCCHRLCAVPQGVLSSRFACSSRRVTGMPVSRSPRSCVWRECLASTARPNRRGRNPCGGTNIRLVSPRTSVQTAHADVVRCGIGSLFVRDRERRVRITPASRWIVRGEYNDLGHTRYGADHLPRVIEKLDSRRPGRVNHQPKPLAPECIAQLHL